MSCNQTRGRRMSLPKDFAAYDRLSPRLRRLVAHAPYDYSAKMVLERSHALSDEEACRDFVGMALRDRDDELRKVWSPDHPMIGQRPKAGRYAS